ncbi:hypothetical protein FA15DRAFT_669714 [Coprinopsis marcescibilis]|uniref:C2H2-type domain-containing protein n=1 Tax=Coprinopsis marcescibilis TaxID=230819 RepID=A0A5C3KWM9_COPMA|nr:hypothetical protein FA15DRAFT_669714 [Coprinopsis marcescibilis]
MSPKKISANTKKDTATVSEEQNQEQRVTSESQVPDNVSETSTARRVTRSQTGRVAKRRLADDAAPESKKRAQTSAKRAQVASRQASEEEETVEKELSVPPSPPIEPPTAETSTNTSPDPEAEGDDSTPSQPSRITFLEVSTVSGEAGERRMSRTRAFFPTPVPNLTKKSRGRRVPTAETVDLAIQPEKRYYICKVEGCGKCFHRGEHLKRHIRSIHTHEKPFKCSYPSCEKFFNRHDNLLQHLKVHKQAKAARGSKSVGSTSRPSTPPSADTPEAEPNSPGSEVDPDSPTLPARPRTIYDHQPALYTGYVNSAPFETSTEPMRLVTNMAVSSLRTELPQSPTETRSSTYPWQRSEYSKDQLTY